jgi:hypothetical protein
VGASGTQDRVICRGRGVRSVSRSDHEVAAGTPREVRCEVRCGGCNDACCLLRHQCRLEVLDDPTVKLQHGLRRRAAADLGLSAVRVCAGSVPGSPTRRMGVHSGHGASRCPRTCLYRWSPGQVRAPFSPGYIGTLYHKRHTLWEALETGIYLPLLKMLDLGATPRGHISCFT